MRLIDADELKKAIKKELPQMSNWGETFIPLLIDNAPTECEAYRSFCMAKQRPHGEWIDRIADKGYVECPFCHKQITGGDLNFCVKCGADMRKGDES